jgi:hypothetical protein
MDFVTTIRADGTIPVPEGLLGQGVLRPGETVTISVAAAPKKVTQESVQQAIDYLRRHLAEHVPPDVSLADELIADRRREAARESLDY